MRIRVKYELGHTRTEEWEREPWYCPKCGAESVWGEQGPGDYYEGSQFMCECGWTWTMPRISAADGWQDEQRLAAIRVTSDGTSVESDPRGPKNAGSKPETDPN